jgi:hypothetical protein
VEVSEQIQLDFLLRQEETKGLEVVQKLAPCFAQFEPVLTSCRLSQMARSSFCILLRQLNQSRNSIVKLLTHFDSNQLLRVKLDTVNVHGIVIL